ncbi:hypothetical protein LD125_00588 [Mesoplasma sp. JKS002658]|uniref:hypothetical protein n=1 Tax=Mesoplasma whartonense TaxID=2878854 RepID=UPI002022A710|nr:MULTISPECIES: hypothetical protein [unclassified Mesoplasma]MCL8211294.1 hypothetical protein [Mesoplasma sp. JKS002664]MCL8212147.1 hypothetical protein [Mesoplasma sp. JKS002662]MCL8213289.1 hypothetical protein [Mesoplasma sp. JKS002660]MCL8214324.1 hypothetical protein [Mesoplasma sp. JKS002658]MCL8214632.1 hypothetical protein [Mesoplasma sp. JKS002663]
MQNTNIKLRRFLASLVNWAIVIPFVNLVFWILNKEPLGQKLFKTEGFQGKPKGERAVFGLLTLVCFMTLIGLLANIYFWLKEEDSIPVMLTKMIYKDSTNTTTPGATGPSSQPTQSGSTSTTSSAGTSSSTTASKTTSTAKPASTSRQTTSSSATTSSPKN